MMNKEAVTSLDTEGIIKLLPHRYPFLLVDRIKDISGDDSCIGIKAVTVNEPFFPGHFPGNPVMPGVLLLEGMAQSAGAIVLLHMGEEGGPALKVFFLTIDKAKFRRPVRPGDLVEYHMKKIAHRRTMWWYRGEARIGGDVACEAEVGAMIARGE